MSKGTCGVVLVLLVAAASFVPAQDATTVALPAPAPESRIEKPSRGVSIPTLSLEFAPTFLLPVGPDAALYSFGAGGELSAAYRIPPLPYLFVGGELGYLFQGTSAPGTSLSLGNLGLQAGVSLQVTQALSARLFGDAGYFLAGFNETGAAVEGNPYFGGGLAAGYDLSKNFTLGAGARFRSYGGLLSGIVANLGASYRFPPRGEKAVPPGMNPVINDRRGLKLAGIRLESVFPVFFHYYDDHPIGTAILRNYEGVAAQDVRVSLVVKQYMDNPKDCTVPVRIAPGADGEIVLYGLFKDSILGVAEATKVSLNLSVQYRQYGKVVRDEYVQTLGVLDRNALTWSDDRKAAAFVSARDPQAMAFAKAVSVAVKDAVRLGIIRNLQSAIAIHEALLLDKITYVLDPASALTTNNKEVVDFMQYPQQTLEFGAGKCGDLTVLYCSLLESIGIPTALITVPGHILMAFDLQVSENEARQVFTRPEDLIFREGKVWLPIETTVRTGHFLDAWAEGVHQWKAGVEKNNVAFYPVREAWKTYNPVVFSGKPSTHEMPDRAKIAEAFRGSLSTFVNRELAPRVAELQRLIKQSGATVPLLNRLGVLYARFGDLARAEEQFSAMLKKQETTGGLLNIGNVAFLRGRYTEALAYYNRALKKTPDDPKALVAVARTSAALEKFTDAQAAFAKLESVDPALAEQYAFLGPGASEPLRAANVEGTKGDVLWQD